MEKALDASPQPKNNAKEAKGQPINKRARTNTNVSPFQGRACTNTGAFAQALRVHQSGFHTLRGLSHTERPLEFQRWKTPASPALGPCLFGGDLSTFPTLQRALGGPPSRAREAFLANARRQECVRTNHVTGWCIFRKPVGLLK